MSWLDDAQIQRLKEVYSKEHPREPPIGGKTSEEIWDELQRRMWAHCKTGQAECIMTSLMKRPKAPKEWSLNRYEWLSSTDIDAAEKKLFVTMVPDYFYVGSVPIDFDLQSETSKCLVSALCEMKLPELFAKGKYRIGIVINTDPHDGPGQHWVAVFCDIRPGLEYPRMTYFDSYAQKPEPEIRTLMKRWKSQWDATKTHMQGMKLTYNKTRHQYKDSECGMYCLYFHLACLLEIPMDSKLPDDVVNAFRNFLFRMPKESPAKEQ
jgi:hypothetical protein